MSSDSRKKGLLLIIGLAGLFFVLLGLLLLYWPQPSPDEGASPTALYVVPAELQILTRPDASAPVLATVKQGERLELISAERSWAHVRLPNGEEGYAERNLLEEETQRSARAQKNEQILQLPEILGRVAEDTELHAGPGFFYPVTGTLDSGERVIVRTREQDFYAIDFEGSISWAAVSGIELSLGAAPDLVVAGGDSELDVEEEDPLEDPEGPIYEDFADRWEEIAERDRREGEMSARELREQLEQRRQETGGLRPGPDGVWPAVPPGGTEPVPTSRPNPNYPQSAQRAGIEGPVIIRAVVRKDGTVASAQILKDLPRGLGEAARRAVERWQFRPATYNGEPISVYYTVTVNFSLSGR